MFKKKAKEQAKLELLEQINAEVKDIENSTGNWTKTGERTKAAALKGIRAVADRIANAK